MTKREKLDLALHVLIAAVGAALALANSLIPVLSGFPKVAAALGVAVLYLSQSQKVLGVVVAWWKQLRDVKPVEPGANGG